MFSFLWILCKMIWHLFECYFGHVAAVGTSSNEASWAQSEKWRWQKLERFNQSLCLLELVFKISGNCGTSEEKLNGDLPRRSPLRSYLTPKPQRQRIKVMTPPGRSSSPSSSSLHILATASSLPRELQPLSLGRPFSSLYNSQNVSQEKARRRSLFLIHLEILWNTLAFIIFAKCIIWGSMFSGYLSVRR